MLPPKQPDSKKPLIPPKLTSARQANNSLSKSKLKQSSSLKKLHTSRGSSQALESSQGNLTHRLMKAERANLPSETKLRANFLTQFINSSADSNKTHEERFDSDPSEITNLLRKLQPQSTKNLRAPEKGSAFKFVSSARSGSAHRPQV